MSRRLVLIAALLACSAAPVRGELADYRSIFVDRFDFPYSGGNTAAMAATIEDMIDRAADQGFTELIWQVRARGDALYQSNIEPPAAGLTPGFDPLQTAIDAAHARGLKLHAWLNTTPLWSGNPAGTPPAGHIFHQSDPSFRLQDLAGELEPQAGWSNYSSVNPILPAVHDHINSVVTDIATNYAVDGIHLDYIRYIPGTAGTSSFNRMPHDAMSHQLFFEATGLDGGDVANFQAYKTFLTTRITDLVRSVKQTVDALEVSEARTMELTASLFFEPNRAKNEYAQDFGRWINEGLLDVAMPMIYLSQQNDQLFEPYLSSALSFKNASTGTRVAPTLASYLHMDPSRGGGVELTLEEIQTAYNLGADGVGFYDFPAYFNEYSDSERQQIKGLLESLSPPEPPPTPPGAPGRVIDDFETDEGHFGWAYNTSPATQTYGLAGATQIDRTTDEAHRGEGSQRLALVSDGSGPWRLRHNSGDGVVAHPDGNEPLLPTGAVGFWLKTGDAGVVVRIALDDPVGNTALEWSVPLEVVGDDQWHLYQWRLEDESQWQPFAGGANGVIDAAAGTVTIDSLWFTGQGDVEIYLDTVSHNVNGWLADAATPGDFNGDGLVSAADLAVWKENQGTATGADYLTGDADGDGDVDGQDFLAWQRNFVAPAAGSASAVPEPSAGTLAALMIAVLLWLATIGDRRIRRHGSAGVRRARRRPAP